MGFRTGAFAKVWEVKPFSDTSVKLRLSVSRKNKQTGEYEQDFSGFVNAVGTAAAKKAASLKEGDRIKIGDVDVTTMVVTSTSPILMRSPSFRLAAFLAAAVPTALTKPEKSCSYSPVCLFLRLTDSRSFTLVSEKGLTSQTLANAPVRKPICITLL